MQAPVDPYRTPAARPPALVVDFRHFSPAWSPAFVLIATFVLILLSHRVELRCERTGGGSGSCRSRDVHAFWLSESERFELGGLHGAKIVRGGKGTSKVALVGTYSTIDLTASSESGGEDEKNTFVGAVGGFLADPSANELHASYGSPWASDLKALFFIVPLGVVVALFNRRVRVVVDRPAGQLRIERSRFPRPPDEETYQLAAVRGAVVEEARTTKGGIEYRVALVLHEGGVHVPLTNGYTAWRGRKERAAVEISRAVAADV